MKSPKNQETSWKDFPFLTQRGIDLIKRYTVPRTDLGMGRFAAYKEYGELDWRIGYGSKSLGRLKHLGCTDRATKDIDYQYPIRVLPLFMAGQTKKGSAAGEVSELVAIEDPMSRDIDSGEVQVLRDQGTWKKKLAAQLKLKAAEKRSRM